MEKDKGLHPRNIHNQKYDFEQLINIHPKLASFVKKNKYEDLGIDFSNSEAVSILNQALLAHHYNVKCWSVPMGSLCPPIPGRVDYIHYIADLLAEDNDGKIPVGQKVKGLDIGTGASCIYPILGNSIYGWKFVGSDISPEAINNANSILNENPRLKKNIKTRFQKSNSNIFNELIQSDEKFDFTMCNPPFYSSLEEAQEQTQRKVKNLNSNKAKKGHSPISKANTSNFGGTKAELWYPGGEQAFISKMIQESEAIKAQCRWFTSLVSTKSNLGEFYVLLHRLECSKILTIQMHQGHKIVHILMWRF